MPDDNTAKVSYGIRRWVLTYENDPGAAHALGTSPITYRHCVYFYAKD